VGGWVPRPAGEVAGGCAGRAAGGAGGTRAGGGAAPGAEGGITVGRCEPPWRCDVLPTGRATPCRASAATTAVAPASRSSRDCTAPPATLAQLDKSGTQPRPYSLALAGRFGYTGAMDSELSL